MWLHIPDFLRRDSRLIYKNYQFLQGSIKEFFATNDKIISIKQTRFRKFNDSKWHIKLLLNGEIVEADIVRYDTEEILTLIPFLLQVNTLADLLSLDEYEKIHNEPR